MPDMIPVGDKIVPPSSQGAISSMSGILGLQQQRQQLQTGQQILQQEQLKTGQQQGIQSFFQNWDPSEHVSDDGTTDLDSALQSSQFKAAGNAKPAIMQALLDVKQKQLTAKNSLAGLNSDLTKQFGTAVGALADDPDVKADETDPATGVNAGRAKVDAFIQNFGKLSPDAQRVAGIYGPMAQHIPPGKLSSAIAALQLQAQSASEQQAAQFPKPTAISTPAGTSVYNAQPRTGIQPGQQPALTIANPPESIPGPGGTLLNRNPGTGALSPAPVTGTTAAAPPPANKLQPLQRPGINAPRADQEAYQAQISQATQDVAGARDAANDPMNGVQATRFRNQQILDLIPHATTGPGLRLLNTLASRLPGSSGDAYQDLEHYTAQNSAALAQKMGVPKTNLGAETGAAAAGNVERNPGALKEITKTNDALNTAFDLYNRGLQKVTGNGNDLTRVNAYKQAFGNNLDVNAVRWADAYRRKDAEEITELTQKLGPQGIAAAQQRLRVLKSLSETGDMP